MNLSVELVKHAAYELSGGSHGEKLNLVNKRIENQDVAFVTFEDIDMTNAVFKNVTFYKCHFINCTLTKTIFVDCEFDNCTLPKEFYGKV